METHSYSYCVANLAGKSSNIGEHPLHRNRLSYDPPILLCTRGCGGSVMHEYWPSSDPAYILFFMILEEHLVVSIYFNYCIWGILGVTLFSQYPCIFWEQICVSFITWRRKLIQIIKYQIYESFDFDLCVCSDCIFTSHVMTILLWQMWQSVMKSADCSCSLMQLSWFCESRAVVAYVRKKILIGSLCSSKLLMPFVYVNSLVARR